MLVRHDLAVIDITAMKDKCIIIPFFSTEAYTIPTLQALLCVVDYHSKFPIVKEVNSLPVDDLVEKTKLIFAEYGLPKKVDLNVGTNSTAKTFKDFYRKMNIQQTITSSYYHQSNGQVEAYI